VRKTTLTLEQTKKEKQKLSCAKWRTNNPEKQKLSCAKWGANNPEKRKLDCAKWRTNNPEKSATHKKKYHAAHPTALVVSNMALTFKISNTQIRESVPQELIELKLLQLTLRRLIQEKRKLK
jgi:hypothetical protein